MLPTTKDAVLHALHHPLAANDASRFDGLCEALSAAKLHAVAKAVREERAGLTIPAHSLYTQQRVLAGRGEATSPIYVTPKGANGARRCTVSGKMLHCGTGPTPPQTPSAMYTSPWMLKQFTEAPEGSPARPRTASSLATTQAWAAPIDADSNKMLYERQRAAGNGWASVRCDPDVLDVEAEQQQHSAATASPSALDISEPAGQDDEQVTPEAPLPAPARISSSTPKPGTATLPSDGARTARRALSMKDAASFYESASGRGVWPMRDNCYRPSTAGEAVTESRARRLANNRSDIFHSEPDDGRRRWSVGPTVVQKRSQ